MWDPYAEFQSATLPNGLTVHAAHWPGRPWEAMGFLIHTGAECDPIGLEGLAHFVEHVVSENASVSKKELQGFFEDCGGKVDLGSTNFASVQYRFFVPTNKVTLDKAFFLFGHMLLSAKIENNVERERQVIVREFHSHYPFKFQLGLEMRKQKALYGGCWLERFVRPLGNPESVAHIQQSDLQAHYDVYYTPANMSIVGVGGMTLTELVESISESPLAASKRGARTSLPVAVTEIAAPTEARYVFEVSKHVTMATPFDIGLYRSATVIPGTVNLRATLILQDMLDEVLNEEVRERRAWAYSIGTSRNYLRHFHEFTIGSGALPVEAVEEIEEVVENCIASLDCRQDLFGQIKRRAIAADFLIDQTGKGVCNEALDDLRNYQRIVSLAEIEQDLDRVTMSDIRGLLQMLRPERRWTLITKP